MSAIELIRCVKPQAAKQGVCLALILTGAATLSACSTQSLKEKGQDVPGAQNPFPKLASVPDKPPDAATERQRMTIQEGLFADRRNARYLEGGGPRAGYRNVSDRVTTADVRAQIINPRRPDAAATRTVDGVRIVRSGFVAAVRFARGNTSLPTGSGRTIVRIAQLQRVLQSTITVVGRAAAGEESAAALARARTVANGLLTLGVPDEKVRVRAGKRATARVDIFTSGGKAPKR
ncbi:MAG: hypothetical protein OXC54_10975 [Rhodospirillaceae bacterium]|nr:hypothetical protein [Rhodospirillaceae bacterium]